MEKPEAELELIDMLESAIEKVKHVRLDHVEEVMNVFEDALTYLEANLVVEEASFNAADRLRGKAQHTTNKPLNGQGNHFIPKKGIDQNIAMMRNVTSDYSSPSLGKRSLGARGGGGGGGGGGLGVSSRAQSSRGTASSRAPPDDDESSDEDIPKRNMSSSGITGFGLGGSAKTEGRMDFMSGQKLKNKLVLGPKKFTRDTSSPSLGNRSLGGAKKAPAASSRGALGFGKRSGLSNENDTESAVAVAPAVSNFHKEVDPIASPANMASSRNLISIASKEVALPTGQEKTPKAGFLRRLDSPESNLCQLRKAREDLTELINKCLKLVPRMDMDKYPMIKNKFEAAIDKLEKGKIVERRPE